ncbi:DNA mismatch repair protein MutS [Methylocystis sp. MJC1]|jgi:DNA mismatch repair protein MutS|uniref:DNA mismatch repair protein MutS n=1 Tax=Methylocystis sp. MJC1 TaxID=2654282 RepID=UPI0013EDEBF6|nr:DNA mismatch repair protein MutS [Methylocystis sp. MJC1]KAF2991845.1 DNA mismatch repair protein MutS [Methylocystis sp. MJC1]UZX11831.1 DNA mismatch repair protein MutS [Methylocystis sp. MJC1]
MEKVAEQGQDQTGAARATPMIAQYIEIKSANADCLLFYRMGDFYELFFEDAEIASRALGIMLTKRGKHLGEDIPMCGVPVERANDYLQKLIALGFRVAVCEQIEDPAEAKKRGAKSVVKRDVVRLVTPGTITEDALLDPARANAFAAVARGRGDGSWRYGVASVDISTGVFTVADCAQSELSSTLARLEPREIVAAETLCREETLATIFSGLDAPVAPLGRDAGDAARRLMDFYCVSTLEGFGALSEAELAAAATAILYVERTQKGCRPALSRPMSLRESATLDIDAATRANLELSRTLSGAREGSLLSVVDLTVTSAGARLLAERLAAPSTDPALIDARLDAVAFFLQKPEIRASLRGKLARAPDLARAVSRLALQRGGPRDVASVGAALSAARDIAAIFAGSEAPAEIAREAATLATADAVLANEIATSLKDSPPLDKRNGDFIREGRDAALDEARSLRDESRVVIASLQARYSEQAGAKLKVKHNNFLGFFLEAPAAQGEKLLRPPFDSIFTHRQTMADAMRFSTLELVELQSKIASAADRALARELAIFDALAGEILASSKELQALAQSFARLDVASALAEVAEKRGWTRPHVDHSLDFVIIGGRHPVVEASLQAQGKAFAANDCELSGDKAGRIAIVTGPNMAGKSTFLRQNALIALLAQAGSYVPAQEARLGVVDRLFSRVGASDDLARGRSTFMVEMVETAAILNCATSRSLVILDEIGRGTATFDGLSIAWATMEHLHEVNCARSLFATHFHELTQLTKRMARLVNLTMKVTDHAGEVVFLHEVVKGAADRSYGVHVAQLAGLPASVVTRAHAILAELEAADRRAPVEALIDDLPLFKHVLQSTQPSDTLREALKQMDPDRMSPREALAALYELKAKI